MHTRMKILLGIMILFVGNIIFYISSEDYRFFLQKIKSSEEVVYTQDIQVDDNYIEFTPTQQVSIPDNTASDIPVDDSDLLPPKPLPVVGTSKVVLGSSYKAILEKFGSYEFEKQEEGFRLFDLTDEYPREYLEYYHRDVTIYLFPGEKYQNIQDVFTVLAGELPIIINEVNNFGDSSFYINLESEFEDDIVRLIVMEKGVVFGLKIQKTEYNRVKEFLQQQNEENAE